MSRRLQLSGGGQRHKTDLENGTIPVLIPGYVENRNGDRMERRYLVYGKNDLRPMLMRAWQEIEDWGRLAREWEAGDASREPVWFEELAEDESIERRTAVFDVSLRREIQIGTDTLLSQGGSIAGTLNIVSWPFWESRRARTVSPTMTNWKGAGYGVDLTGSGTLDGRIAKLVLTGGSGFGKAWCGIRRQNSGAADFVPIMYLANIASPTYGDDASKIAVDPYALLANTASEVTFATTPGLVVRQRETLSTIITGSVDLAHYVGKYQAFIGCKLTAADTIVGIQLRHGYSAENINSEVWLSSASTGNVPDTTYYYWIPVGKVEIPGVPYLSGVDLELDDFTFAVFAERKSGSGYLRFDGLFLLADDFSATYTVSDDVTTMPTAMSIYHTERDERFCVSTVGTPASYRTVSGDSTLLMSPDATIFTYLAGSDALGKRPTSLTMSAELTVYDRWSSYGGNG